MGQDEDFWTAYWRAREHGTNGEPASVKALLMYEQAMVHACYGCSHAPYAAREVLAPVMLSHPLAEGLANKLLRVKNTEEEGRVIAAIRKNSIICSRYCFSSTLERHFPEPGDDD